MSSFVIGIAIMCMTSLFFLFVFGFFAYLRYLKHKELMAFAEKGLLPPEPALRKDQENSGSLRQAIILIGVGAALCIGLYPIGWIAMPGRLPLNLGPWMVAGLIPLFFGVGLLLIHFLPTIQSLLDHTVTRHSDEGKNHMEADMETMPQGVQDAAPPREALPSALDTHDDATVSTTASTTVADRSPTRATPPTDR